MRTHQGLNCKRSSEGAVHSCHAWRETRTGSPPCRKPARPPPPCRTGPDTAISCCSQSAKPRGPRQMGPLAALRIARGHTQVTRGGTPAGANLPDPSAFVLRHSTVGGQLCPLAWLCRGCRGSFSLHRHGRCSLCAATAAARRGTRLCHKLSVPTASLAGTGP